MREWRRSPTTPTSARAPLARAARWAGVIVWMLAGLQAAYWGWQGWGRAAPSQPQPLPPASAPVIDAQRVARALGGGETAGTVAESSSPAPGAGPWRLVGVVAGRDGAGSAVLARDGQPPRAVRQGTALPDGWRVARVERDAVTLVPTGGGEAVTLRLPAKVGATLAQR